MSHRTAELERQLWGPNLTNFLLSLNDRIRRDPVTRPGQLELALLLRSGPPGGGHVLYAEASRP
jgi:hypothetical protein